MRQQPHAPIAHLTQPTQRPQVLLHAVVGSLVLCAVLVPAAAPPGALAAQEQNAAQPAAREQKARLASPRSPRGEEAARAFPRATGTAQAHAAVLHNMTAAANGKQLAMRLEMSRAQAGNLLRQHRAIP